jgi:hypothetical protein
VILLDADQNLRATLELRNDGGSTWVKFQICVCHALHKKIQLATISEKSELKMNSGKIKKLAKAAKLAKLETI